MVLSDSEETLIDWSSPTPSPQRKLRFPSKTDSSFDTYSSSLLDEDEEAFHRQLPDEDVETVCETPPSSPPTFDKDSFDASEEDLIQLKSPFGKVKEEEQARKYPKDFYVSVHSPPPAGYSSHDKKWPHDLFEKYAQQESLQSEISSKPFTFTDENGRVYSYEPSNHAKKVVASHPSSQQYIERQRFLFHTIDDEPLTAIVETLCNNRVVIYGADDSFVEIAYNPEEVRRVEQNTYSDQSMKWRDKFVPEYSILRAKAQIVERYVPRYSRLAKRTSRWREGIYRCFDSEERIKEDEEYAGNRNLRHLPKIQPYPQRPVQGWKKAKGQNKKHQEGHMYGMEIDLKDPPTPPLTGVRVDNLAEGTEEEDVKLAFSEYGAAALVVSRLPSPKAAPSMLIVFQDEFAAYKSVRRLNNEIADGNVLTVQIAQVDQVTLRSLVKNQG